MYTETNVSTTSNVWGLWQSFLNVGQLIPGRIAVDLVSIISSRRVTDDEVYGVFLRGKVPRLSKRRTRCASVGLEEIGVASRPMVVRLAMGVRCEGLWPLLCPLFVVAAASQSTASAKGFATIPLIR